MQEPHGDRFAKAAEDGRRRRILAKRGSVGGLACAPVVGAYAWLLFVADENPGDLALVATALFMSGAVTWPIGILVGSMRTTQAGVVLAGSGTV